MPSVRRPPLKRTRCLGCGELATHTVLGRCARCTTVVTGSEGDWRIEPVLTRSFKRGNGVELVLTLQHVRNGDWELNAVEVPSSVKNTSDVRRVIREHQHCRVGSFKDLVSGIVASERFGRRWLEGAPGTSIATYVARPHEEIGPGSENGS